MYEGEFGMYSLDGLRFIFMRACTHVNDKGLFDVLIRDWNEEIDRLNHSQQVYNQKGGAKIVDDNIQKNKENQDEVSNSKMDSGEGKVTS